MATNYPTSLDNTTNQPVASALSGVELDGDGNANKVHSTLHGTHSEAIVAIETKIGTGASTPSANKVLRATGTGTSAWAQVGLTTDVTGTLPLANGGTGATALTNLITLGTHTTGNYLATLANATNGGTTIANSGSETAAATVALNLNDLSAGVMADGDSFAFIDSDDSNATKKEALADLLDTIAGTVGTTGLDRSGATLVVTDLHPVGVSGSANQLLTDDGDGTVTSESNLTFDGSTLTATANVALADAKHLQLGGSRMATSEPAANQTGYGIVIGFDSAGSVALGDAVFINTSGKVAQANAVVGSVTNPAIGIALNAGGSDGDDVYVLTHGVWRNDSEDFSSAVGAPVYLGETAGAITKTAPTTDGDYVQRLGIAISEDCMLVMPSIDVIEHA